MTSPPRNRLLSALPPALSRAVWDRAHHVSFAPGDVIQASGPVSHAYFVTDGAASLWHGVTNIELAVIGSEGLVGHPLILGLTDFPFEATASTHVEALKIGRDAFDRAIQSDEVRSVLLAYVGRLLNDLSDGTAVAAQSIKARLARRLLLVSGRTGDLLHTTHEQLAQCLSVRRPGVTTTLHELEGQHLIRSTRGAIKILDREGLQSEAQLLAKRRSWPREANQNVPMPRTRAGLYGASSAAADTPGYSH